MKNLLSGLVGLVLGTVWGSVVASELFFGAPLSPSAGTGISVGICVATRTAMTEGYMTEEEANRAVNLAAERAESLLTSLPRNELITNNVQCDLALDRLRNIQR